VHGAPVLAVVAVVAGVAGVADAFHFPNVLTVSLLILTIYSLGPFKPNLDMQKINAIYKTK
jgi:hypothetical protein